MGFKNKYTKPHILHGIFAGSYTAKHSGRLRCMPRRGLYAWVNRDCTVVAWSQKQEHGKTIMPVGSAFEALGVLYWLQQTGGNNVSRQ